VTWTFVRYGTVAVAMAFAFMVVAGFLRAYAPAWACGICSDGACGFCTVAVYSRPLP
jgi:hypothetical protein